MELLPGKPLGAALRAGRLPLPKALSVAACVADALKAAHDADLTHRDIKPSNIIIRTNGKATVIDFGITKGNDERPGNGCRADPVERDSDSQGSHPAA
ncbi:protein kinase domain-containing protein [Streptomyces sp. DH10]|uniref:protein kinase domain-containing protein n=1 Tax=Streptomyces sp. DH10 TaxID=3040121 RepID=UPI0030143E3D